MKHIEIYESWKESVLGKEISNPELRRRMRQIMTDVKKTGQLDGAWYEDEDFRKEAFAVIGETGLGNLNGLKFFKALDPDRETVKKALDRTENIVEDLKFVLSLGDKIPPIDPDDKQKIEKLIKESPGIIRALKAML
jgi:hypothetical protein